MWNRSQCCVDCIVWFLDFPSLISPKQPGNQKSQKPIRKPTRTSGWVNCAAKFQRVSSSPAKENDRSSTMNTAGELKLWILTFAFGILDELALLLVLKSARQMGRRCFQVGR